MQRTACAVDLLGMTPVRFIPPGSVVFVSAGAVGQLFRFVPNRRVKRMFDFCLRAAATDFEGQIELHEFLFMSNHFHLLLTDVAGVLPAFMAKLNSLLSSNLNAMRGTTGKNFEGYNAVILDADDLERQVESAVYTLNNAAAAHLVTRCRHWKGTSSFELTYGEPSSACKPNDGIWSSKNRENAEADKSGRSRYRSRSKYPDEMSLTLHPLPGLEDESKAKELRARVLKELTAREDELIRERREAGIRVVGWRQVEAAHFNAMPGWRHELFGKNPTFAASTAERREALKKRLEAFYGAYYEALKKFNAGERDVVFPHGTWLMVQRHKVRVADP